MKYHKFVFLICFILLLENSLSSQTEGAVLAAKNDSAVKMIGIVKWDNPSGLENLVEKYKTENFKEPGLDGFRVQVFSDGGNNARERAMKTLNNLQNDFPELDVYLSYQQPNFRVRCGNFRTKAEARQCQLEIIQQYPGCFIVRDLIRTLK
jgi:hypothetical protein